jgi:hypothetical protein
LSKKKRKSEGEIASLIDRFIEGLTSGEMTITEGDRIIEQLRDSAVDIVPRLVEMLTLQSEENHLALLTLLRELDDRRIVGALRRMLQQPDYSDKTKLRVIQALDVLGAPIDEGTFRRAISDPEALMQESLEQMLETIADPGPVQAFLEMMEEAPSEMPGLYIQDVLAPLTDRRLLLLFAALLYDERDDIVMAAIDAIERIKEPATIPLLQERAQYDPSRQVRHAAENAALRLQVRVGDPKVGDTDDERPPWITPSSLPLDSCLLCTMDGSGGQVLFVSRERPDGDMHVFDVMFNDHEGIKECFAIVLDEDEMDEMTHSFGTVEFVEISLERARAEVARALQVTLDARRRLPPEFVVWRGWLGGEDSRAVEEFPLPVLEPSQQAELLAECEELAGLEEFDFWFFNPEEVEDFVPRYRKLQRQRRANRGQADFEALLDEAIEAVIDDDYRRLLSDRLRRQAWLLAQLYEEVEVSLWALAAAAALEEGVTVEHPLLREMMDASFLNAVGEW